MKITRLSIGGRIDHEIASCHQATISHGAYDIRLEFNHKIASVTFIVDGRHRVTISAAEIQAAHEFMLTHTEEPAKRGSR